MRSLRGRLTLGVVLVLAAVLPLAGVLVVALRRPLRARGARRPPRAHRASSRAATALDGRPERPARRTTAASTPCWTRPRTRCASSLGRRCCSTPARRRRAHRALPPRAARRSTSGGARYRAYVDDAARPRPRRARPARGRYAPRPRSRAARPTCAPPARAARRAGAAASRRPASWLAADARAAPAAAAAARAAEHRRRRGPRAARAGRRAARPSCASLAASFNAMLARLGRSAADRERALDATRRFAADAGHELRTPLTSVQATLVALAPPPRLPAGAARARWPRDALAEQRRLVELLDGLQALARGDARAARARRRRPRRARRRGVVAAAARHPDVTIDADAARTTPVAVRGWEPGLRMLVDNLVENAAAPRPRRRAGARRSLRRTAPALSTSTTTAPGIPEDERERDLRAVRAASTARDDAPGSGLGLALVAQQARHHGARRRGRRLARSAARASPCASRCASGCRCGSAASTSRTPCR